MDGGPEVTWRGERAPLNRWLDDLARRTGPVIWDADVRDELLDTIFKTIRKAVGPGVRIVDDRQPPLTESDLRDKLEDTIQRLRKYGLTSANLAANRIEQTIHELEALSRGGT